MNIPYLFKKISCTALAIILSCMLVACQNAEVKPITEFPWPAFQRLWSKGATDITNIEHAQEVETGYFVDYGEGVMLNIFLTKNLVTGARLQYLALPNNTLGGMRFTKVVNHMMYLGSFRWTREEADAMREFFGKIDIIPKEYRFQSARFKRSFDGVHTWTFEYEIIPFQDDVWSKKGE